MSEWEPLTQETLAALKAGDEVKSGRILGVIEGSGHNRIARWDTGSTSRPEPFWVSGGVEVATSPNY